MHEMLTELSRAAGWCNTKATGLDVHAMRRTQIERYAKDIAAAIREQP